MYFLLMILGWILIQESAGGYVLFSKEWWIMTIGGCILIKTGQLIERNKHK